MNRSKPFTFKPGNTFSPVLLRLYILTFLFYSANAFVQMIVPLYTQSIGMDNSDIGMIIGAYLLVSLLLRPWAGLVVDRLGLRRIMRFILVAHLFVLLLYCWAGSGISFVIIRGLQGAVAAFFSLSVQMAVMDTLPERDRAQGLSIYLLFGLLPSVMMPAIGWIAWEKAGLSGFYAGLIVLAALTLLISCGLGKLNQHRQGVSVHIEPVSVQVPTPRSKSVKKMMWASLGNRRFIMSSIVMVGATTGFGAVTAFLALYVQQTGVGNAGLFFAIQSGVIVAARFASRTRLPSDGNWHSTYIVMLLFYIVLGLLLVAFAPVLGNVWLLYGGGAAIGLGIANVYPVLATYLSIVLGQQSRKIWMGLFISMSDLGTVIGSLVMGVAADYVGYGLVFQLCAGMSLCIATLVAVSSRWMNARL
ncbi:staphylopine family metallophore export MFS transporter CntE [Paenibacillus sp. NPDC056933]|uniref:staphylopine family metallophore export MFS transporter CntE n=1 Tax=Paenibacillus sp. NPDC056933 TaxID=3345968 RepID=UPI00363F754F